MTTQSANTSILEEIFIKPANTIKTDRFASTEDNAAACSGQCHSGACKTLV
jgi:hypothetical protein